MEPTMSKESEHFGLREEQWQNMSEKERDLYRVIRPLRRCSYRVDVPLGTVEDTLASFENDARSRKGTLELNPDFQRGHVWSQDKQVSYLENLFRGVAPRNIRFNCAGWYPGEQKPGDLNPGDIVCMDGLQRLTAARDFLAGKITIFGGQTREDLAGTSFDVSRFGAGWNLSVEMFQIATRADLLQFYLDINTGGVVHSEEELSRVKGLLEAAGPARGVKKSKFGG
jgi:hypothetical protein